MKILAADILKTEQIHSVNLALKSGQGYMIEV